MQNEPIPNPFELIAGFQRCMRYPTDEDGVFALAQGLKRASMSTGSPMVEIVQACLEISKYCPTDSELLSVAKGIRDEAARAEEAKIDKTAEWQLQYGRPEPYDIMAEREKIMPEAAAHWAKDRQMCALIRQKTSAKSLKAMGHLEYLRLQIWAQEQVGIAVTPEQRKEVRV